MEGRLNILIVDDNKGFVRGLKMLLENFHSDKVNRIHTSYSGLQCFDILQKNKIDLIFMDYSMPGLNGADIAKRISNNFRYLKIIALTFHTEDIIVESMIYAGAHGYICKNELSIDLIGKHLDNARNSLMLL